MEEKDNNNQKSENIINQQLRENQIDQSSNNKNNKQDTTLRETLLNDYGFYANINGEDFDPREVSVLSGNERDREITQIMKFLFDSYPIEAIYYCLKRSYISYSSNSLLDKTIKYLLDKYEEEGEIIINNLVQSYYQNFLNINISPVQPKKNPNEDISITKLIFYDYSKGEVLNKKLKINEIFIEIDSKFINNNNLLEGEKDIGGLSLKDDIYQENFLGKNHHLFKRFCRRNENIYVFNFIGFENKKIEKKNKRKANNKKEEKDKENYRHYAIFKCENEDCNAVYTYSFNSNKFRFRNPHLEILHELKKNLPDYYEQNIQLLKEKNYITDIQLVIVD